MLSFIKILGRGSQRPTIFHNSSDPMNLEEISDNFDFIRKGSGLTIITGAVGQNVHMTISENSSLKITGNISKGCKILKEGNGTLTIEGTVADDLILTVYGKGTVFFTHRPSEEVIRSIKNRGQAAQIICAGSPLPQPGLYMHHNLGTSAQQTTTALSRLSVEIPPAPRPQLKSTEDKSLDASDKYNSLTEEYINCCQKYETIDSRINKLNLTEQEEALFEGFKDCIMFSYFDSIPVMYDEKYYNLSTLLELHKTNKPDPYTKKPLKLANIGPARKILNDFDDAIIELKKRRETVKQQTTANPHDTQEEKVRSSFSM